MSTLASPVEVDSLVCDRGVVSELVQVDFMWYSVLEEASVLEAELEEGGEICSRRILL